MSYDSNVAPTATMSPTIPTAPTAVPATLTTTATTIPTATTSVPATFVPALTPGGASQDHLDYTRSEHIKLYLASTKALDTKYNGKLEHLRTFLSSVEIRVDEFGCIVGTKYLFREHGLITQQNLEGAAARYTAVEVTRSAQNAQAMYEFLMNSVDQDLTSKLVNCVDLYKFGDRCNGHALLKIIISLVQVVTTGNATPYYLETLILNLPKKIKDFDSIVEFNSYVRSNLQSLENYGRKFDRVLPLLFQSYQAVDDEEFANFIETLLVAYDHGLPSCIKDGEELMRSAEEQYKLQVLRASWKMPSKTQAQIIALKAQLANKGKPKGDNGSNPNGNNNKPNGSGETKEEKNAWKKNGPKKGEPTTIKRDNLIWHCGVQNT